MFKEYWNRWNQQHLLFFEGDGGAGGGGGGIPPAKEPDVPAKEEISDEEAADIVQAQEMLKIMKNPASRKAFITQLAEQEGITKDSSKQEIKVAKRNIQSILQSHLGDEFPTLKGSLEKIFTEFADLIDEERIKPVNKRFEEAETAKITADASKAYDSIFAEYSNSKELEAEVTKLSSEIRPGTNQSPEAYFRRLLVLAASEKGVTLTKKGSKDTAVSTFTSARRNSNRSDASSRLASEGVDGTKVTVDTNKGMSLDEAIKAGAKAAEAILRKS